MPRKPATDPLRSLPGYALRRASATAFAELKTRMAAIDLRVVDASVLLVIRDNPGITQSTIGRMLEIARPNMVTLTSRLLERDLAVRSDLDGRSHGIALTAAGEALTRRAFRLMKEHEVVLMGKVPAAYHQPFLAALEALLPPGAPEPATKRRDKAPATKAAPRKARRRDGA